MSESPASSSRPGRSWPLATPTKCGVCGQAVLLFHAAGSHALLDESAGGTKGPHVCPEKARIVWEHTTHRFFQALADALADRSEPS